jgi:hypothetical protein
MTMRIVGIAIIYDPGVINATGFHPIPSPDVVHQALHAGEIGSYEGFKVYESKLQLAPQLPKPGPSRPWVRSRAEQWKNNRRRR